MRPGSLHSEQRWHHFRGRRSGPTPAPRNPPLWHGRTAAGLRRRTVDPRRCIADAGAGAIAASVPARACRWCGASPAEVPVQHPCGRALLLRVCGIYTHHRRRSNPDQYGYNVACLEGIDPFALGLFRSATGQPPVRPHRLGRVRRGGVAIFCQGAMPLRPARAGRFSQGRRDVVASSTGRKGSTAGPEMVEQPHGRSPGTGTIKTRPGWA